MNKVVYEQARRVAEDNGWYVPASQAHFEKDGYQVYFFKSGGYELSVRDPDTTERVTVFKDCGTDTHSPAHIVRLMTVLKHAETIVSES